jgi:hypothetical protein
MELSPPVILQIFTSWCNNVEIDSILKRVMRGSLIRHVKFLSEDVEGRSGYKDVFEPLFEPSNSLLNLLPKETVPGILNNTTFEMLIGILTDDKFSILENCFKGNLGECLKSEHKVVLELVVQYIEFEMFSVLCKNSTSKTSLNDLVDGLKNNINVLFKNLESIQNLSPHHIFQLIIPETFFKENSSKFSVLDKIPQILYIFPLAFIRLIVTISILIGFVSEKCNFLDISYTSVFELLITSESPLVSFFSCVDNFFKLNPKFSSSSHSSTLHSSFLSLFAENIKLFVSSLPTEVEKSIKQSFKLHKNWNSFIDMFFFMTLRDENKNSVLSIFNIEDFQFIKRGVDIGAPFFQNYYLAKLRVLNKSKEYNDDDD